MTAEDIFFQAHNYAFSYRIAGILIVDNHVLLQRPPGDPGYAFPGGQACFGETNAETLAREFKEELAVDIRVKELRWVGEIFFPWNDKPCQQVCLFYTVELPDDTCLPKGDTFEGKEKIGDTEFEMPFHWISLDEFDTIYLYPPHAKELLKSEQPGLQHFIYKEGHPFFDK